MASSDRVRDGLDYDVGVCDLDALHGFLRCGKHAKRSKYELPGLSMKYGVVIGD